jgi:hypothetical protein
MVIGIDVPVSFFYSIIPFGDLDLVASAAWCLCLVFTEPGGVNGRGGGGGGEGGE